ncbi:hypothetical protein [Elizabethkingia miricola]|uniref:hypothetical protein n=1 Tax=Elizabethkingia miricola TaxID=172045 RepID=UPI003891FD44
MKTKKQLNYAKSLWIHTPVNVFIEQAITSNKNVIEEPIHFHKSQSVFEDIKEAKIISQLAIGRLFSIMSIPYQEGDLDQFYKLKDIIMEASEYLNN